MLCIHNSAEPLLLPRLPPPPLPPIIIQIKCFTFIQIPKTFEIERISIVGCSCCHLLHFKLLLFEFPKRCHSFRVLWLKLINTNTHYNIAIFERPHHTGKFENEITAGFWICHLFEYACVCLQNYINSFFFSPMLFSGGCANCISHHQKNISETGEEIEIRAYAALFLLEPEQILRIAICLAHSNFGIKFSLAAITANRSFYHYHNGGPIVGSYERIG